MSLVPSATSPESRRQFLEDWKVICADPLLAEHPYRVETNGYGQAVMTPPPAGWHSARQSRILVELFQQIGPEAFCEVPLLTSDGVKAIDVGWYSPDRYARVRDQDVYEIAPEICVEVWSPSNRIGEMNQKRDLYFEAGADEVWWCDVNGKMSYFPRSHGSEACHLSVRCPNFPVEIKA